MIRVVIADDQQLFRQGLSVLLSAAGDIEVVGEARDGDEAIARCVALTPDVVLMDLRMPNRSGADATRALRQKVPSCRVLVLTTFDDDTSVFDALSAGALGYVLKDTPAERLFDAIRATAAGHSPLEPAVAAKVIARFARLSDGAPRVEGLSVREEEVLRLLARGASNKEIASELRIAEGTVKNHLTNVFTKLGVDDRTQAALRARALGLG